MLLELARPVALLGSMLSLLAVFHTAFLGSETDYLARMYDSLGVLLLAAGFSLLGGLAFLENGSADDAKNERRVGSRGARDRAHSSHGSAPRITETFPMQIFCWTTGIMAVLFLLSWYLETHCIFYRNVRF